MAAPVDPVAKPKRPRSDIDGRQVASAAQAIVVVLLALLVAALVNADSLVASIEGQAFGTSRSVGLSLARPARTVSHWTGLNLPRKLIDDLVRGRSTTQASVPRPQPARVAAGSPGPTTTTSTTLPPRRTPGGEQPLKVWLAGDSMIGTIAESFIDKTAGNPIVAANDDFQIGTGLARPDVYNWPAVVSHEMATVNPDVVIYLFGANDDQDMEVDGQRLALQSPAWQQEYAKRVNQIMDETADGVRQVVWLGIPAVRRPRLNQTKDIINSIVKAAAPSHPGVEYADLGPLFDGPGSSFTTYRTDASGKAVTVRESDGIHITLAGANLVTPILTADIDRLWHLSL